MKTIQILLFLFVFTSAAFAQNTDPISYHSSHQMSDTSYSLKKANGDSTIFLFEGGGADSAYTRMSVNADSTQVIFDGNNHPPDTLEVWGMGNNADTTYSDIFQQNDSTLIFQKTSGVSDTVAFFGVSKGNAGIQADWNETDSQQADFIKNKPTLPGIVLTTTGSNGNATLSGDTLNIPNYSGNGAGWNLTGNAGTTSSDFIGTTDNQPLVFKVNNIIAGFVQPAGSYNQSFGYSALKNVSTGIKNFADGPFALYQNTTGYRNTAVGYTAFYSNTTGGDNTIIGALAAPYLNGFNNTVIGVSALNGPNATVYTGNNNTAIGSSALRGASMHSNNIGIGYNAGFNATLDNTLFISDSTRKMYFALDSAAGTAPSIIGKDANGYWHTYQAPNVSGGSNFILTTSGTSGAAMLTGDTLNIPVYTPAIATASSTGVISIGSGLSIDSVGKLSTSLGLFKHGSVPYAGPGGTLIEDTTGLV